MFLEHSRVFSLSGVFLEPIRVFRVFKVMRSFKFVGLFVLLGLFGLLVFVELCRVTSDLVGLSRLLGLLGRSGSLGY